MRAQSVCTKHEEKIKQGCESYGREEWTFFLFVVNGPDTKRRYKSREENKAWVVNPVPLMLLQTMSFGNRGGFSDSP